METYSLVAKEKETVVTTRRSPSPSRPKNKSPSTTPGRPPTKAVKFSEPKPLPPAIKPSSSSSIRCHDVRLADGDLEKNNVRIESAGDSPTPPVVVSSGKSRKREKYSRSKTAKKPAVIFLQEDGTPIPIRAKPGWLSTSNPPSKATPKSPSSSPLRVKCLPAPIPLSPPKPTPSAADLVEMQKKLVEQQAYLDKFYQTQQKWSSMMEKDIHNRTQELGVIADALNLREKVVVAKARRLQGEKSASSSSPQPQLVLQMPRLEPAGTDYATSEPSSEWSEDSPSPPRQVP